MGILEIKSSALIDVDNPKYKANSSKSVASEYSKILAEKMSNVKADVITIMKNPRRGVANITNPEALTGGTAAEISKDYDFLRAVGALGQTSAVNDVAMVRAFAAHGIGYIQYGGDGITGNRDKGGLHNEYFIGGKQVTREAAYQQLANKMHAKIDANTGEAFDISKYI